MEIFLDPEEKLLCPYNPAHHIIRKRMNTHLVKCKKSYPNAKLVECDFNVNHKIPEPELRYHHENCADRKTLEIKVYQEEGQDLNKYPIFNPPVTAEESWDDANFPTYKPIDHIAKREVIRGIDVQSAAKRREFRQMERKRIAQLNSTHKPNGSLPQDNKNSKIDPESSTSDPASILSRRDPSGSTPVHVISESTPESVADLLNRIQVGKKTSFIPKCK